MPRLNEDGPSCLICGGETNDYMPVPGHGTMRRCLSCGFVFANPMSLPSEPPVLFGRAYEGNESRGEMSDFHLRISLQQDIRRHKASADRMLSLACRQALILLKSDVPRGSTIFDIGCGMGHFLDAVNTAGYKGAGLDVAGPTARFLQQNGHTVWHGTIDTVPPGWIEPQVCTCFFVLHHMTDPIGFLTTVRSKFPEAILIVAVSNFEPFIQGRRRIDVLKGGHLPPRSCSWWGGAPLRLAMERAGYEAQTMRLYEQPRDVALHVLWRSYHAARRGPRFVSRCLTALYFSIPTRLISWVFWPVALYRDRRWGPHYLLAVGHPRSTSDACRGTPSGESRHRPRN
jgi:SAM-dependent methyltransferase